MIANLEQSGGGMATSNPPIAILGIVLDNVTIRQALQRIEAMIASRQQHYVVTANADFLVQASRDLELRRILLGADLAVCDGTPVLWASRFLGNPLPERVAGSDLVPLLLDVAAAKGYRVYFLGAAPERAEAALRKLRVSHPNLIIAGHYSPPFSPLLDMNHEEIVARLRAANPDILFVCFGCPKQEKWMAMHYRDLGVPVSMGVGGTMDFLAGYLKRAPGWMQRSGTEWLFRLGQEPRRLFKRYVNDLRGFGWGVVRQWWQVGRGSLLGLPESNANSAIEEDWNSSFVVIRLPARFDANAARCIALPHPSAVQNKRGCVVDMRQVTFIDSTGIACLIRGQKDFRDANHKFILLAPSKAVRRSLTLMRLSDFFTCCTSVTEAQELLGSDVGPGRCMVQSSDSERLRLSWNGEITAANATAIWARTETALACPQTECVLDLKNVEFMDSTGLGILVRAKKAALQDGKNLRIANCSEPVRNVVDIANLGPFLLGNKKSAQRANLAHSGKLRA